MTFSSTVFALALQKKLQYEDFDIKKISRWCHEFLTTYERELDEEMTQLLFQLATMEDDPQFEYSKEELRMLAYKLIRKSFEKEKGMLDLESTAAIMVTDNFVWLINWWHQINGHRSVSDISIGVDDGPSWYLKINIKNTDLINEEFSELNIERDDNNWVFCCVKDGLFEGYGGVAQLPELLHIFREWVQKVGGHKRL